MFFFYCFNQLQNKLQFTPALTDLKESTILICYRISNISNIGNKKKLFKGLNNCFSHRQIFTTDRFVIAGFNCLFVK